MPSTGAHRQISGTVPSLQGSMSPSSCTTSSANDVTWGVYGSPMAPKHCSLQRHGIILLFYMDIFWNARCRYGNGVSKMLSSKQIQRQILKQAAARPTSFILPLPSSLSADPSHLAGLLEELIEREYVVERPLLPHETFWIEEVADESTVLVITGLGSRAVLAETSTSLLKRSPDGRIDSNTLTVDDRPHSHVDKPILKPRRKQGKLQQMIQVLDATGG